MNGMKKTALTALVWLACNTAMAQVDNVGVLPDRSAPAVSGPFGVPLDPTEFDERYNIRAARGIQMQEKLGYGQGRTTVEYRQFVLEADRMVIDFLSGDIQAEGNVIFRGSEEFIRADGGRFNFITSEGAVYGVDGQANDFYFRAVWDESKNGPAFRQIDEKTSIFRGTHVTTNPFPKPMYFIKAEEVIFVKGERVFFKNPVLYVRDVPVFWLPAYTRNLKEGSPWSQEFGYSGDLGAYIRIGYRYIHRVRTPSWEDPTQYETRSHGLSDTFLDLMSDRGTGIGMRYAYQFDYKRHTGFLEVYGLRDSKRDPHDLDRRRNDLNADGVIDDLDGKIDTEDEGDRWVYRHRHFSALRDDLSFQLDIDKASDPDVHYDVLDNFAPDKSLQRGRLYEQRLRAAMTYHDDDQIARIVVEQRERLAVNTYQDQTLPFSDDLNFDPDPVFNDENEYRKDQGIPARRYAQTRDNGSARYATRLLNLANAPLYYRFEANAFNSLDAGLNPFSPEDDTRVKGLDLYAALTHRLRLGPRTTWTNTAGVGAALYDREDDRLIADEDFKTVSTLPDGTFFLEEGLLPDGTVDPEFQATPGSGVDPDGNLIVDTARFQDQETVFLGDSTETASPKDVNSGYLFADYTSRLNHRFTEFLDGNITYFIRQGTDDSLGQFYEQTGNTEAFDDIHDFYTDRHTIEGTLNFYLRYPRITAFITARENLQGRSDIYANEQLRYIGAGVGYENQTREFSTEIGPRYDVRQQRDPSDPNEFEQETIGGFFRASYLPKHARHWASLEVSGTKTLSDDPVQRDVRQRRRFDENETEVLISPTVGRRFGPKYRVQLAASYNTRFAYFPSAGITILRDLLDAELGLFLGVKGNSGETRRDDDELEESELFQEDEDIDRVTDYELDVRASIRFKIGRDQPGLGQRSITTLSDLRREGQYVQ